MTKKIIIAIDSFKGSLSSAECGNATAVGVREAFLQTNIEADIRVFPVADGGEGTIDALCAAPNGEIRTAFVTGALGEKTSARYGIFHRRDTNAPTAVIEMAEAAGLPSVPPAKRNPLDTTTFGVGELILAASGDGCRDFVVGIGGSATNDGGLGMMSALGAKFFTSEGKTAGIFGRDLKDIAAVDLSETNPALKNCRFKIACDVTNPLCGEQGCSAVFAPQKGADEKIVRDMDAWLKNFSAVVEKETGATGAANISGAGAAGGLGFAFAAFLHGELAKGAEVVTKSVGLADALADADLLIVGEGRLDGQSVMGKAPVAIAALAKKNAPQRQSLPCAAWHQRMRRSF